MAVRELKDKLEVKLERIANVLCESMDSFNHPGVLDGISGLALFMFYYSRFTRNSQYAKVGGLALERAVTMINDGYNLHTFCNGISGLAWTCEHLAQHGFIDRKDISFLEELNPYLLICMERDFCKGNYDFFHGGLGVGYQFITAQNANSKTITMLLDLLKQAAEEMPDGSMKWKSLLNLEAKQTVYNISLSHGMSSIVACLSKLIKRYPVFAVDVIPLLFGVVNYILQQKLSNPSLSYFPPLSLESSPNSHNSRLGWCYGDLGIANSILGASKIMNNNVWEDFAIEVLTHNTHRKDSKENLVRDAGLCHGSSGVAHIFHRLYMNTNMKIFNDAVEYWYQKTLDHSVFGSECAGYKRVSSPDGNEVWDNDFGLLTGITGIGLSMMSYLNYKLISWDECMLLN